MSGTDASGLVDPEGERAGTGPCARFLRRTDADRFLLAIAAPPEHRPALFALYACNAEIAKTREVVSEPMLGEIRLQWWREAIAECFEGNPRRHEVVLPLATAIRESAPERPLFETLIDARARDLEDGGIESLADFETYARATSGNLIRLAQQMIAAPETAESIEAAGHAGIAYALIGQIRAMPHHLAVKHTMLPRALLRDAGADETLLFRARPAPEIAKGAGRLLEVAEDHLAKARALRRGVPAAATPVFLATRLAASHARQLRRAGGDPFDGRLANPPALRALALAWAARTGRW